jgi:hypothetical protein
MSAGIQPIAPLELSERSSRLGAAGAILNDAIAAILQEILGFCAVVARVTAPAPVMPVVTVMVMTVMMPAAEPGIVFVVDVLLVQESVAIPLGA